MNNKKYTKMTTKHHDIKIAKDFFIEIENGNKTCEIRNDDRDYQRGDTVRLWELYRGSSLKTDRSLGATITHVTSYRQKEGYVVFSFRLDSDQ